MDCRIVYLFTKLSVPIAIGIVETGVILNYAVFDKLRLTAHRIQTDESLDMANSKAAKKQHKCRFAGALSYSTDNYNPLYHHFAINQNSH